MSKVFVAYLQRLYRASAEGAAAPSWPLIHFIRPYEIDLQELRYRPIVRNVPLLVIASPRSSQHAPNDTPRTLPSCRPHLRTSS